MTATLSRGLEQRWQEVLRRAAIALEGHGVGVWEADARDRLHLLAASSAADVAAGAAAELKATLRDLGELQSPRKPRRWVVSRVRQQRWCIAPVRREPPQPPPTGIERRGRERMMLELAGVCIGLIDDRERRVQELEREDCFENAPVGLRWTAADGTILGANQTELDTLGYQRDEYVGRNLAQFYVDPQAAADALQRLRTGETLRNVETRMRRRDGSMRHGLISASGLLAGGQLIHARWATQDVTERQLAEQALTLFKALVESADDAVIGKTLDGAITSWNPAAARLYGYSAEEVIGKPIALLAPPDRVDELPGILERLRRGERIERYETTRVRKDGTRVEVSLSVSPILDPQGRPIGATSIAYDVTARKQAEQQLVHGALHDALTDLPNRTYFVERVSQSLARVRRDPAYRFAVLFLDFDDFKAVNDSLGHAAGDHLLGEIAGRLRTCVRPGDVVARLGGDEFTLLLEEITGLPDAEHAARRIQDSLATPFSLEGREILASASIGVALSDPDHGQVQDLLRDADLAMYHAKQQGRARFQVFDVAMRDSAEARSGMEADLRNALERDEFRLVFQPIVELESGRVHGFEALLRWHHPKRGVILPLDFVPLAEQTGLIIPIGRWVLQEACRHARGWQETFPAAAGLRISVNLSAEQLGHPRIVEEVRTALQTAGLAPPCLSLEISERVLMESVESSTTALGQLRGLNVELHMDDFGTGYSSLSSLPRFPLQGIKVDRSLVHRMGARRTDLEIVRSIVDLAGNLGLGVIAEGVETVTQRARLIAFGCRLGQGQLFAKPLEPAAAGALLAEPEESDRRIA